MNQLSELARRYKAYVCSDSEFQRRARILQSIWRTEQGYEIGIHKSNECDIELGSRLKMPWAKETINNYITDTIRSVVQTEVLDPSKSKGKLYSKPRIFDDLLSSQPLCFNLFGELQQDLPLATRVFRALTTARVGKVIGIEFEYSPGRGDPKYTGDRSAFDVYFLYETSQGGQGFGAIEVKYHEDLKNKASPHKSRYDEIAEEMSCFNKEALEQLKCPPLQQIWRDHLLAGILRIKNKFDDGFFILLYPQDNRKCAQAVKDYRNCLSDSKSFETWTLEQIIATIKEYTNAKWIDMFADRYLNFDKLQQV